MHEIVDTKDLDIEAFLKSLLQRHASARRHCCF